MWGMKNLEGVVTVRGMATARVATTILRLYRLMGTLYSSGDPGGRHVSRSHHATSYLLRSMQSYQKQKQYTSHQLTMPQRVSTSYSH